MRKNYEKMGELVTNCIFDCGI